MTWTKLSDDFGDDCWSLSSDAFRLHVEGLTWSNRKLLDLRIPKDDLRRFAKCPDAVAELLAVQWWADAGSHYVIRHHASYQRSSDAVVRQQAANEANGRKGGRPAKPPHEQAQAIAAKTHSVKESVPVTQSVSDSLSKTSSERDRPGQNGSGLKASVIDSDSAATELPAPKLNGVHPPGACRWCGKSAEGFSLIEGMCRRCKFGPEKGLRAVPEPA